MSKDKVLNKKDQLKNPTNLEDTFNLKIFSKSKITEIYRKIKLIRETEFKIALTSVNFQLGTKWYRKFPSAWKALCHKDYDKAMDYYQMAIEGEKQANTTFLMNRAQCYYD